MLIDGEVLGKRLLSKLIIILRLNSKTILLLSLVIVTAFLSTYSLETVPNALYYDEISSAYFPYLYSQGRMDIPSVSIVISLVTGEYWVYRIFGPSAFWIRLPSALYGVLFVVVCWLLASELYGSRVGLMAGFLASAVPWSFYFRRWGSTISIAYLFYVTLAVYVLLMYFKTRKAMFKYVACILVVVSFYTHAMALFFNFIFFPIVIALKLHSEGNLRKRINDLVLPCLVLFLGALPLFITYLSTNALGISNALSRTSLPKINSPQFLISTIQTGLSHLSPDFLVVTGGRSFGLGSTLYFFGSANGSIGMLSVYGLMFYLWFILSIYHIKKKKFNFSNGLLIIWWVTSYALASCLVYYDNPNAARNIVGLTSFILAMSLSFDKAYQVICAHIVKKRLLAGLKVLFVIVLLVPYVSYANLYFATYSEYKTASSYPDIYYRDLAKFITERQYWDKPIVVNSPPEYVQELQFYSNSVGENIWEGDIIHAFSKFFSNSDISVMYYIAAVTSKLSWSHNSSELTYISNSETVFSDSSPKVPIFVVLKLSKNEFSEHTFQIDFSQVVKSQPWHADGPGERGDLILFTETSKVKSGSDSLGIIIPKGNYNWAGHNYYFETEEDWKNVTAISLWFYGTNSNVPVTIGILCEGGRLLYTITDSFEGWQRLVIPFFVMTVEESPSVSLVEGIGFYSSGNGEATVFIDDISLIAYCETAENA